MEKMKMESLDLTAQNVERIGELFPNCITESVDKGGKPRKAINFEMLRQMLSDDVIEGDETYEFTWVGKKASIVEANTPIRKTLRPCVEESKDWDTTENLYIEGDNLEVLKLLQESYLGKVKVIYIDPPYNTGNDFIYRDDFTQSSEEYDVQIGVFDDEDNQLFKNTDSNGRFHSDWCSMIYSRLLLARNLLSDNGAIFISIDSHELMNIRKMCDEVFGEHNFIDVITWFKKASPSNDAQFFSNDCEFVLVYAKNKIIWRPKRLPLNEKQLKYYQNPDDDPRGPWNSATYTCNKSKTERPRLYYPIINPFTLEEVWPKETAVWAYSQEQSQEHQKENLLYWGVDGKAQYPRFKKFVSGHQGVVNRTLWHYEDVNHTQGASLELGKYGLPYFQTPKPTRLIKRIMQIATDSDSIIMDFFSGSATTADAVMQLNSEDGGRRKYILVQLPESCDRNSAAFQDGYKNICEIGKERIRRAGDKIKGGNPRITENLDIGFRIFKLDDSNMKDVYYSPEEYNQNFLDTLESNIKEDRTDLDLLFGCLLEWGIPLSFPYSSENIDGCTVHNYNNGDLIACFDESISDSVIKAIARKQPLRVIFRDSSFANSPSKINVNEIFKMLAPDTRVKVI